MAKSLVCQNFSFQGCPVRTVGSDRDQWFVAKDVCEALGIAWRGRETLEGCEPHWIGVRNLRTHVRQRDGTLRTAVQEVIVISEPALYRLAFRSNKPAANQFTNWVSEEVLPAIRRTGEYSDKRRRKFVALGKSDSWIDEREEGITERKSFTQTLHAHEVSPGVGYAQCTNEIYKPVLGGGAATLRMERQLKPKSNVRDHLSRLELMKVKLAEALAAERIEDDDLRGDHDCQAACRVSGEAIAEAIETSRTAQLR